MANFAYLRVSTDRQDTQNQKLGILDYCNSLKISPLSFVEDTASGKLPWRERAIGSVLENAKEGDLIIVSEVSRLGRSTLQVLEILELAAQKKVSVHITKNRSIMDGSMQSTITATVLGLASQIEREFMSARTIESLAKLKADGKKLGRPQGQADVLKLDNAREQIQEYLKKGINKRAVAKLIECSPQTLYTWLKRNKLLKKSKPVQKKFKEKKQVTLPIIEIANETNSNSMKVKLWLRVENNNKFVRGKKRAREEIEQYVLSDYDMKKIDDYEYELTIPYESKEDLDDTIYDLLREAESTADSRHCFTESDVTSLNGEHTW